MSELRVERKENMAGGKGHVIIKHILEDKELNGKCKMYAEVTLEPGCSLGYHEHHNESETYYILRGEGNYDDNGRIRHRQERYGRPALLSLMKISPTLQEVFLLHFLF